MIERKKQQVTEELQHIEDRIKRNFDNRLITKPECNEIGEQDVQDADEPIEDVLTESQIAVASVSKKQNDHESKGEQDQQNEIMNEPSDSSDLKNIPEETNSVMNDCVNTEQSNSYQETSRDNDILQEKIEAITQSINEEMNE